jgi:methyl-accepting chemotaxis protein
MYRFKIVCYLLLIGSSVLPAQSGQNEIVNRWKRERIISPESMNNTDKRVLRIARQAANECAQALERAIEMNIKTEKEIFSALYFPIFPLTSPRTFTTFYDDYTDSVITPIEDKYLAQNPELIFVAMVDKRGYLPSHNTKYSQPFTGKPEIDVEQHRTKRIFNDITGYLAARNTEPFLIQVYNRDTGEHITDMSIPIWVKERHWGAIRIGYKR